MIHYAAYCIRKDSAACKQLKAGVTKAMVSAAVVIFSNDVESRARSADLL